MFKDSLNGVGQVYRDFVVTNYLPLEEIQSILIELIHVPSGARVIHIANNDSENLFCLSFRTLPDSSNGVAHILEHTVLCGSRKYPVKDPFFAMTRRSLNTFMNALTGLDFTCYPASSQVEKDFYNLMEVYIDAVFHPELKKVSFLQEGHRLEFTEPKNEKSPLQFQGVVYNEMKGNLSSSDSRLWRAIFKYLLPDLPYSNNAGGDPQEIPNLTHEELLEFHRNFYHPSRCLFFFYGDIPTLQHLDFITEKALQGVAKIAPSPPLPKQPRFKEPLIRSEKYPIAASENSEKKAIVAFAWLTTSITDQGEILSLSLLESLLMNNDASPLRMALLQSNLCTQASSSIGTDMSEVPWLIICKGCEPTDAEALRQTLFKTLEEIASKPIEEKQIEAALHELEFDRTEINTDEGPFGLNLFMKAALIAQHGSDPQNGLLIHTLFNECRAKLEDPQYLQNLIRRHLIDNPHFLQLTLEADPTLEKKEAEEERKKLDVLRSRMSPEDEKKILEQSESLSAYQEATEHQSLECLPKIFLSDVPLHARDLPLEEISLEPMHVFHHCCFTNNILYADLIFDLPAISLSDLPLVSLFTRFLTEVGSGGRNYAETLHHAQAYTGGISASLSLHISQEDPNLCRPTLSLKGKALSRNSKELFRLFADIFSSPDFSDEKRVQELLSQHVTSLQNRLTKNALNYAIQTSLSGFSIPSFVFNQWNGTPYHAAVLKWAKHPKKLAKDLNRIQQIILSVGSPHLVLSCDASQYEALKSDHFYDIEKNLPKRPFTPWTGAYQIPEVASQVRFLASPVAFTALGMKTVSYSDPQSPLLLISTQLLQNVVLLKEIREKGGAYGADAAYFPTTGNFYLYAFRDPHLAKTASTFQKALEKIGAGGFNEQHLEEAKLGVLQTLDAPISPGARAMTAYAWKRAGRTQEMREAFRKKIFTATRSEVADAVKQSLLPSKQIFVSYLGEALFEKEKKKLKNSLAVFPLEQA